ncbi:MAG TPA: hypothetical protein VGG89_15735 [Candidatus Baltobacteraceae bacterium]
MGARSAITAGMCAIASGALFFFSTNLGSIWPLAWLAATPVLWLAYGRARSWQVLAAAFAAFALGQLTLFEAYGIMAATLAVLLVVTSAAFAAGVLLARLAYRRLPPAAAILVFPAYWTAFEFAFTHLSPNGSYGSIAYSQTFVPVLIQSAALVGLGGVTFLICVVANAIAMIAREPRRALWPAVIAASLVLANVAFGFVRLDGPAPPRYRVAAAADDRVRFGWTEAQTLGIARSYARLTTQLAAQGAHVVVFSEKAAEIQPQWLPVYEVLRQSARVTKTTLIAGFEEHGTEVQNVALVFRPDGSMLRYVKQRLLLGFENYPAGTTPGIIGDGQAVEICKDMDYPHGVRNDVRGRDINVVFVPALDFSLDVDAHARLAIMRGVEDGFAVVRASRFGLLTVTDANGRVIASAASDTGLVRAIVADVPLGPGHSLYLSIGDSFDWLCVAFTLVCAGVGMFHRSAPRPPLFAYLQT